jgi:Alkylmercury lyase
MLLFRSEEHVDRWSDERGLSSGAVLTLDQTWGLARRWYADRLDPMWRRRTAEEAEAVFAELGLTGPFWRLQA